jgi:predicted transcriptional regulator
MSQEPRRREDAGRALSAGRQQSDTTPRPAVSVKQSVQREYIVCLEDGEHARTVNRHLRTAHGLSPQQYRKKWRLPRDLSDDGACLTVTDSSGLPYEPHR